MRHRQGQKHAFKATKGGPTLDAVAFSAESPDQNSSDPSRVAKKSFCRKLRALLVEESPTDAELVEQQLTNAGYEMTTMRVSDSLVFSDALRSGDWNVVLADCNGVGFGAIQALELLNQSGRDLPLVIVAGSIDEELAVTALRAGAHDYVLKSNLVRLVPAIERAMREATSRNQKREADATLRVQIAALQAAANAIVITDRQGNIEWVNSAFTKLTGYTETEAVGRNPRLLKSGKHDPEFFRVIWTTILAGKAWRGQITNRRKDGLLYEEEMTITPVRSGDGTISHFVAVKEDISERKRAERDVAHQASFPRLNPNPIIETDLDGNVVYANAAAHTHFRDREGRLSHLLPDLAAILAEFRLEGKTSTSREIEIQGRLLHKTIHYLPELGVVRVYFVDVTERKRAEEALRASEKEALARASELAAVLDAVPAATFTYLDRDRQQIASNRAAHDLLRLPYGSTPSRSAVFGESSSSFRLVKDGRELSPEEMPVQRAALTGEALRDYEFSVVLEDGTSRDLFGHAVPLLDEGGMPRGAVGAFVDISERKRAERELRESESRYRTLFESIDEGFCVVEILVDEHGTPNDWRYLELNPAFVRQGFSSDFVGKTAKEVLPTLEPRWYEMFGKVALTGESIHYLERFESLNRWYEGNAFRVGEPSQQRVAILFQDVTEKKRAEEALASSEQRYRSFVEASSQVIWRTDPVGQVDVEIPAWNRFTGQTPEEAQGWGWMQVIAPEDRERVSAAWRKASQSRTLYDVEYCLRRYDGVQRHVHARGVPILECDGSIREWIGTCIDVTEQRQAEAALRASEERLKTIVENLSEGVIIVDFNGETVQWNAEALRMHGYEGQDQSAGFRNCGDVFDLYSLDGTPLPSEQWPVPQLMRETALRNYEVILRRKGSEWERIFSYSGTVVRDAAGKALGLLSIHDVTTLKKAEKMLVRNEKLASVGRMAATIAHEINNPLASAMNALFLASTDPSVSESVHKNLDLAEAELERVAHITKQTLGFYRESGSARAVDLGEIAEGILGLYGPKLRNKSVSVRTAICATPMVQGIEGELRQILSNLVANSIDAVSERATLHVRISGPSMAISDRSLVRLTVADNGSGISPADLRRIFEPFFTTKEAFGTGLGLWVTKGLVDKHEGKIRVRSRTGKGTVFCMWLPAERRHQERD